MTMEEKEELAIRKEIAAQVWDEYQDDEPQPGPEIEEREEQQLEVDEWAGVSPALRKTIEGCSTPCGIKDRFT